MVRTSLRAAHSAFQNEMRDTFRQAVQDRGGERILRMATQLRAVKNLDIRAMTDTLAEVRSVKRSMENLQNNDSGLLGHVQYLEKVLEEQTKLLSKSNDNIVSLLDHRRQKPTPTTRLRPSELNQRTFLDRNGRERTQNATTGRFERRASGREEEKSPQVVILRQILDYEKKNYDLGRKAQIFNEREARRNRNRKITPTAGGGGFGIDDILGFLKDPKTLAGGGAGLAGILGGLATKALPTAAIAGTAYGLHRLTQNVQDANAQRLADPTAPGGTLAGRVNEKSSILKGLDDFAYRLSGGKVGVSSADPRYEANKQKAASTPDSVAPVMPRPGIAGAASPVNTAPIAAMTGEAVQITRTQSDVLNLLLAMKALLEEELANIGEPTDAPGRTRSRAIRRGIAGASDRIAGARGYSAFNNGSQSGGIGPSPGFGGDSVFQNAQGGFGNVGGATGGGGGGGAGYAGGGGGGTGRSGRGGSATGATTPKAPTVDISGMGSLPGVSKELPGVNGEMLGKSSEVKDDKGRVISTNDTTLAPEKRAFLDTIAMGDATSGKNYWESPNYNTIVGGQKFDSYADHPRVFGTATSTAAGRYQFTKTTWDGTVKNYNKEHPNDPITDFSPRNQDRAALYLAQGDYKRRTGGRNLEEDLKSKDPAVQAMLGEQIKKGLGGSGVNTTWEILQRKSGEEIKNAFDSNLKRNQGYGRMSEGVDAKSATADDLRGIDARLKARIDSGSLNDADKQRFEGQRAQLQEHIKTLDAKSAAQASTATPSSPGSVPAGAAPAIAGAEGMPGKIRSLPIKPELQDQLKFAAEKAGVKVELTSGGQTSERDPNKHNQAGGWTGSHRHDDGGAGDLQLTQTDPATGKSRVLSADNPQDAEVMKTFAKEAVRAGATGVGAGPGYMGPRLMHIGGGDPAVWGPGGGPYPYMANAYKEGRADTKAGKEEFEAWKAKKIAETQAKQDEKKAKDAEKVEAKTAEVETKQEAKQEVAKAATPAAPNGGLMVDQQALARKAAKVAATGTTPAPAAGADDTITMAPAQTSPFTGQTAPTDLKSRTLGAQVKAARDADKPATPNATAALNNGMSEVSGPYDLATMNKMSPWANESKKPTSWFQDPDTGKWKPRFDNNPNPAPDASLSANPTDFQKWKSRQKASGVKSTDSGGYVANNLVDKGNNKYESKNLGASSVPPTTAEAKSADTGGSWGGGPMKFNEDGTPVRPATGTSASTGDYPRITPPAPAAPPPTSEPAAAPAQNTPAQNTPTQTTPSAGPAEKDAASNKKMNEIEHQINDFGMKSINTPAYA